MVSSNHKPAFYLCVCLCLAAVVVGFNDEAERLKWSPKYLYEKVYSIPSRKNPLQSSLPVVYNSPEPKKLVRL